MAESVTSLGGSKVDRQLMRAERTSILAVSGPAGLLFEPKTEVFVVQPFVVIETIDPAILPPLRPGAPVRSRSGGRRLDERRARHTDRIGVEPGIMTRPAWLFTLGLLVWCNRRGGASSTTKCGRDRRLYDGSVGRRSWQETAPWILRPQRIPSLKTLICRRSSA